MHQIVQNFDVRNEEISKNFLISEKIQTVEKICVSGLDTVYRGLPRHTWVPDCPVNIYKQDKYHAHLS